MSKKVKKLNTVEEVTEAITTDPQLEMTSIAPTEKTAVAASGKEEKKEETTKNEKETQKKAAKPAKKTAEKKTAEKKTAKETKETKAAVEQMFIQYAGNEYATSMIYANIKDAWVAAGHKVANIKSLNVYVKPEENAAYYVINDKETGKINL